MTEAEFLEQFLRDTWTHAFLVFLRIGAVFFFLPIFGASTVPVRVKLGLVLACTMLVAPLIPPETQAIHSQADFFLAGFNEVFVGLAVGFATRCIFLAVQVAGTMSAQSISLSQIMGNQVEQPTPALGQVTFVAAMALACILDFHVMVVVTLAQSYDLVPLGTSLPQDLLTLWSVTAVANMFDLAFALSGPFLVIAILYNLCLGVINKAMPQLMVAFVGAPAITWLGLFILLLSAPVILAGWKDHLLSLSLLTGRP